MRPAPSLIWFVSVLCHWLFGASYVQAQTTSIVPPAPVIAPAAPAADAAFPPQVDKPPDVAPVAVATPVPQPSPAPGPPVAIPPNGTPAPPLTTPTPTATPQKPEPGEQSGMLGPGDGYTISGDLVGDMESGIYVARSPVTLTNRDFVIRGNRGSVNFNTHEARLSGNLVVTAKDQNYSGQSLVINTRTGRWILSQLASKYPPESFPPGTVLEPIFVKGGSVSGVDNDVVGSDFRFTSCDRDHYFLQAKQLQFYQDKNNEPDRIVLRHNALYVFNQKLLPLPVYVISLKGARSRRTGLQTAVGQNQVDGIYVKSLYDLRANNRFTDSLLIDGLQKRGLGLGFQRELARGAGLFYLYALSGKTGGRQVDSRVQRLWRITPTLGANLNYTSSKNNSLSTGEISNQNGNLTINLDRPNTKGNFIVNYAGTGGTLGSSSNSNATLDFAHRLGQGLELKTSSLLAKNEFQGGETATFDNTVTVSRQGRTFDTAIKAELHNGLTGLTEFNGAYQLERLPEFAVLSNTERMKVGWLQRYAPADMNLTFGAYNEPSSQQRLSRAEFKYNGRSLRRKLYERGRFQSSLATAVQFQQDFYTNNTARYNYGVAVGVENKLGRFGTQFNYIKQKALGFTPFLFDFLSPGESLDANLSYQAGEKIRANFSTGRDLQNHVSRDVIGRLQLAPSRSVYASFGANYSTSSGQLGDIIANIRLNRSPQRTLGGALDLGVRYTPQSGQLSQVNVATDFRLTRTTQIQALAGYNGIADQFDFAQVRVVQDLHCFQLYTTFDRARRELRFDLAIKAFPFIDTRLGQNQFGSGFDARIGGVQ